VHLAAVMVAAHLLVITDLLIRAVAVAVLEQAVPLGNLAEMADLDIWKLSIGRLNNGTLCKS
jgi:hypothetical protein